jgi:hypothetical protein
MSDATTLGGAFAEAFAAKDVARMAALLHPEIDFRGLTPNRAWRANGADQVVSDVLRRWLDDFNDGAKLVDVSVAFVCRNRVAHLAICWARRGGPPCL